LLAGLKPGLYSFVVPST